MNTYSLTDIEMQAHEIRKRAGKRRRQRAELREFLKGGSLVMSGLFLAALYTLLI
jgi:hypothetical protein